MARHETASSDKSGGNRTLSSNCFWESYICLGGGKEYNTMTLLFENKLRVSNKTRLYALEVLCLARTSHASFS